MNEPKMPTKGVVAVAEAEAYIGKQINNLDFIVTRTGVERAVKECGERAVRRFFADGVDSISADGKKVSDYLKE